MKELSTAIFSKLSGSALSAHIGNRLFKGRAPEGAEYPYAVYIIVSNSPEKTFSEDFENTIIQFSLFSAASGSTEVEDMYEDLIALYDECAMTLTSSTLVWMKRTNATLMIEDHTTPAGTVQVWHYAVDFEVMTSLN
ncbi:MAG: DUF3168 domain-containing protein [Sphaerochaeta sp.]|nr:DUF3168 domain-containing protein [Sphaerochaeta sp.]